MKIFNTWSFLKHWRVFHKFFRYYETKKFEIKPGQPSSTIQNFLSTPENFWNTDLTPTKFFGPVKQKTFRQNYMPPPLHENIRCQSFFETKKGSPAKFVDTMRQRCFNGEQWYLLFMQKFFSMTEFFWHIEWFPHEIFRHCETKKNSTQKSDIPSLCIKFVDTRVFLKYWIVTPRTFRHSETLKNFNGR